MTCQHCVSLVIDVIAATDPSEHPCFCRDGITTHARASAPRRSDGPAERRAGELGVARRDPEHGARRARPRGSGAAVHRWRRMLLHRRGPVRYAAHTGRRLRRSRRLRQPLLEVCDPATRQCVDEVQCTIDQPCDGEAFCIQQNPRVVQGACYPACTPFASGSCAEDQTCVQYGISEQLGYCLWKGGGVLGAECETKDAGTGCNEDAVCRGRASRSAPSSRAALPVPTGARATCSVIAFRETS